MKRNLKSYEATTRRGGDGDWERESGMLESHKKGEAGIWEGKRTTELFFLFFSF